MTMPHERTRSVRWGYELLEEMLLDETIDEAIRATARSLVATYPSPDEILNLVEANAQALPQHVSEALVKAGELWVLLRRSHQGTEATKHSLMYVERHYPEPWIAQALGKAPLHGVRSWLLPENHDYTREP